MQWGVNNANGTSVGSLSVTSTKAEVSGDYKDVSINHYATESVTSVVDSAGNVYHQVISPSGTSGRIFEIWRATNIVNYAAGDILTVHFSPATYNPFVGVSEYTP